MLVETADVFIVAIVKDYKAVGFLDFGLGSNPLEKASHSGGNTSFTDHLRIVGREDR